MNRLTLGLVLVVSFGGCAIGRVHAYNRGTPEVSHRGSTWVALAVQDQRGEVVSGKKKETFVGLSRGGYGNAFDVNTESKQPLATDFGQTVWRGLAASGYRVTFVKTSPRQSAQDVSAELLRTGAPRALFIGISEWHSDTYNRTQLIFDVSARVLDYRGQQLASTSIGGRDVLGGSFMDPGGHAEKVVPLAFKQRVENLLNRPELGRALELQPAVQPSTPVAPPAPAPSMPGRPPAS